MRLTKYYESIFMYIVSTVMIQFLTFRVEGNKSKPIKSSGFVCLKEKKTKQNLEGGMISKLIPDENGSYKIHLNISQNN